jgi:hypothetical protein
MHSALQPWFWPVVAAAGGSAAANGLAVCTDRRCWAADFMKQWRERYFVLVDNPLRLFYYYEGKVRGTCCCMLARASRACRSVGAASGRRVRAAARQGRHHDE